MGIKVTIARIIIRVKRINFINSFVDYSSKFMPILKRFVFLFVLAAIFSGCDEDQQGPIPFVPVDMYLGLNEPSNQPLAVIGGWVYVNGGSKGLLVVRTDMDTYTVYDRNCTYNAYESCVQVDVLPGESAAVDSCCGSKFSLFGGTVLNGPASIGLVQYTAEVQGNVLHIYN